MVILEFGIVLFLAIIGLSILFKVIKPNTSSKIDNENLKKQISDLTQQIKSLKEELELKDGRSLH